LVREGCRAVAYGAKVGEIGWPHTLAPAYAQNLASVPS
jgi:hypothetical protein